MLRLQHVVLCCCCWVVMTVTGSEVKLPRRIVGSCAALLSALESPETASIDVVRSFECDTSLWNRSVVIERDVFIQGRRRRGDVPHIDWRTSSNGIIAGEGTVIQFRDLIFLQSSMGIGSIDILFFRAEENARATFEFIVVGVSSCPSSLNVSHFEYLDRPPDYPGRQLGRQINENTVEAHNVVLHWSTRNAIWELFRCVFTCNVVRNSPELMEYHDLAVKDALHVSHGPTGASEKGSSRDTGMLVIYILVSICGVVGLFFVVWFLVSWSKAADEELWNVEIGTDEKEYRVVDENDSRTGEATQNKASPTPENWSLLNSDVALEEPLGHGEFGKVYRGRWQGTTVAVKVIKHNDRCLQTNVGGPLEAFFAKHISHPNVVQTYQISKKLSPNIGSPTKFFGNPSEKKKKTEEERLSGSCSSEDLFGSFDEDDSGPHRGGEYETWLILEYCDRGSLTEAVASGTFRMPRKPSHSRMSFVAKTALEIASAMNYLHSVRIIHGDLKTANVLLKGDGSDSRGFICKVGDFGLSRFLAEDSHIETFTCGTVTHMPPELLKGGVLTSAADVYSFAILLWELLSGRKPHQGKNQGEIVLAVVNNAARPPFPPNVPKDFMELIESCWRQNHLKRPIFPDIIDALTVMLEKYEKEEGLVEGARSSHIAENQIARSSFFSPQESGYQDKYTQKGKSIRFVPKKFNSLRASMPAPEPSLFLDTNRSAHLSLGGADQSEKEEPISTIMTSRSADDTVSGKAPSDESPSAHQQTSKK